MGELYLDSGDSEGATESFEIAIELYIEELDSEDTMLGVNNLDKDSLTTISGCLIFS